MSKLIRILFCLTMSVLVFTNEALTYLILLAWSIFLIIYLFIDRKKKDNVSTADYLQKEPAETENNKFSVRDLLPKEPSEAEKLKDKLCILFLCAIAPLFFMILFLDMYVQTAYIVMTIISLLFWLIIDRNVSTNDMEIFPKQMSEIFKFSVAIIFLYLLYSEIFIIYPASSVLFFVGIIYILINLLAYFISIVKWF